MNRENPTEAELQDPEYWRIRAEEIREGANAMDSLDLKERMLELAAECDKLAERFNRKSAKPS